MRAALLPSLLLLPLLQNAPPPAPPAPAQKAPPAEAGAVAATDAAATGFLQSVVDRRVYSLEGAGAATLAGSAKATFEVIARNSTVPPTLLDLRFHCDYATGAASLAPVVPPTAGQSAVAPVAIAAAQNVFAWLPSRNAKPWIVSFAQEGEKVRLDYKPAPTAGVGATGSWSEWHTADGTPVRRLVKSFVPVGQTTQPVTQEVLPVFVEKKGRLLLSELKPGDPEGRFSWTFEYEEKEGFFVLKKLVEQNEGWRLTLDFTTEVARRAAK